MKANASFRSIIGGTAAVNISRIPVKVRDEKVESQVSNAFSRITFA